jgi:hypothetical protein
MAQANPIFPRAEEDNLVYVAAPSVGHEIGIMVAGIISMLLGTSCVSISSDLVSFASLILIILTTRVTSQSALLDLVDVQVES